MGAKRVQYQIVGRYMDGKEVTAYHLQSLDTGKSGRYTKEQVCFLVGRDQVTNCTGQIYQDKVLLRGKDVSLEDLPVQYEDGGMRNTDKIGKVRRGTNGSQAMEQLLIVSTVRSGNKVIEYVLQNAGGGTTKVSRKQLLELVANGRIGNARLQNYQGKVLLRGVNCKLDELPYTEVEMPKTVTAGTPLLEPATKTVPVSKPEPAPSKVKTTPVIAVSQLNYGGNGKFKVALVDFSVCGNNASPEQLKSELEQFIKNVKKASNHRFANTDEMYESTVKGVKAVTTFDDPYYSGIDSYMKLANKLGAKFVIESDIWIRDAYEADLDAKELAVAKKELTAYLKSIKQ